MIQRCPNCGTWVSTDSTSSGGTGGAMAGVAAGAAAGSILPGVGNLLGGIIGGVAGAFMGESDKWEFVCPDCGHEWTCEDETEDETEYYNAELEWKNQINDLVSATPTLINSSREEKINHIKALQAELAEEFVDNYKGIKSSLYDALAYSQLVLQNDTQSALASINQSLALFPGDSTSLAIGGMIFGVRKNPYDDYRTMKWLVNYKDVDYDSNFTHFTKSQFAERFDSLTQNYVNGFLEIPVNNRRFLVVDDELRTLPESFVVLPISMIPRDICFPSGHPRAQELYVVHPYKPNEYIPYNDYQLSLFRDELREFSWIMECLGAKSLSFRESQMDETSTDIQKNAATKGGADYGMGAYNGNASYERDSISSDYKKLTSELMEAKEYCITPETPPYIPQDIVWYQHRPDWHRNCESRKSGRLVKASFKLSTSSISATSAQEKKKIEADLKILLFKANGNHDQEEQISLRSEENHTWSVDVEFYPLTEYSTKKKSIQVQPQTLASSLETNSFPQKNTNYTFIAMCLIIVLLIGIIVALIL